MSHPVHPHHPASYPKRLLVLIAGLTPQVVTETLYALATQSESFIPTQIHLVTTQPGAERIRKLLLGNSPGHFSRLSKELELPPISFSAENIHVLRNSEGEPLLDIRTPEDNACVADQIMQLMRNWTEDPQAALHVSLAGGRKTMTYYLGTALSLFGRAQDRLSHVLVDERFENHRDFFFPTRESQVIYDRDNAPLDTSEARVILAEIPFVRLANERVDSFTHGKRTFSELVDAAQLAVGPLTLMIDPVIGKIEAQGQKATLRDADMAFMLWFISQGWDFESPWQPPAEGEPCLDAAAGFLQHYEAIQAMHGGNDDRPQQSLKNGMDIDWFRNRIKHLKQSLTRQFGASLANQLRVALVRRSPAFYGLNISTEQIVVNHYPLLAGGKQYT